MISPVGLVPKKKPGEFRLIHHLSHPRDNSVNSGIPREFTSVSYHTVDQAIAILCTIGPGAYLAKTDIKSAFRIIPIHPASQHLLGFTWRSKFYVDKTLSMGLSVSCNIFEAFSTAIQWISEHHLNISHMLHILDDFLIIAPSRTQCMHDLDIFTQWCDYVGVPLAPEKTAGPDTTLVFAGIELDSVSMEARLPRDKLERYRQLVCDIRFRKKATLRELQAVIGSLNHCSYIIPAGRPFLRRLINLTIGVDKPHLHIRLNKGAREDLRIWHTFLQEFNGKAMFMEQQWITSHSLHLYTDSAQSCGYAGVFQDRWFYGAWPDHWQQFEITVLELYPIVIAVHLWGQNFTNKRVTFHTDNMALVYILNKLSSKDERIMVLVRHLTLLCLTHNILFKAVHIPGIHNQLADHLSRFNFQEFQRLAPHARQQPDHVPPHLLPHSWRLD